MPRVGFDENEKVEIADGRHRLAEFFNAGEETVELCVPKTQAAKFTQEFT